MKLYHDRIEHEILAVIGCRGGSKRLKRKCMQNLGGKTLLQHAIEKAVGSRYIDRLVFDSEDNEMLEYAEQIKRNIQTKDWHPERKTMLEFEIHKRNPELSEDNISLYAPVRVVVKENPGYDIIVILQADCPVKGPEFIDYCIEKYMEGIKRCIEEGTTFPFEDVITIYDEMRTGTCRVISREAFLGDYPTSKIIAVEDRDDFVDIHTEEDLKKAEKALRGKHHDTFWVKNKIRQPIQYNTHMIFNHFSRYFKAIQELKILKSDVVMDTSCGLGYGSFILSFYAKTVYGLDVNEEYLKLANELYKKDNLRFCTYEHFMNDCAPVDKIVFIETFEHVPQSEIKSFLYDELFPCLKKGGELFLTAPIGKNSPSEYNEYHLNEPSLDNIYFLFKPYFAEMDVKIKQFTNSYEKLQTYCTILFKRFTGIE